MTSNAPLQAASRKPSVQLRESSKLQLIHRQNSVGSGMQISSERLQNQQINTNA